MGKKKDEEIEDDYTGDIDVSELDDDEELDYSDGPVMKFLDSQIPTIAKLIRKFQKNKTNNPIKTKKITQPLPEDRTGDVDISNLNEEVDEIDDSEGQLIASIEKTDQLQIDEEKIEFDETFLEESDEEFLEEDTPDLELEDNDDDEEEDNNLSPKDKILSALSKHFSFLLKFTQKNKPSRDEDFDDDEDDEIDSKPKPKIKPLYLIIFVVVLAFFLFENEISEMMAPEVTEPVIIKKAPWKKDKEAKLNNDKQNNSERVESNIDTNVKENTQVQAVENQVNEVKENTETQAVENQVSEVKENTQAQSAENQVSEVKEVSEDKELNDIFAEEPLALPETTQTTTQETQVISEEIDEPMVEETEEVEAANLVDENKSVISEDILKNLEEKIREDEKNKDMALNGPVKAPDYEYSGRALVYNCTGKHWACVNDNSYKSCNQNYQWNKNNNLKIECYPFEIYIEEVDCTKMQQFQIDSVVSTEFCQ